MFELAHTGTLFLDEIGELHPALQVKLLRVLDSGEYYCLGGKRKMKVDVRIVAATNRDLRRAIEDGKFRSDFYHRLAQVRIDVPPLRERSEDILPIARFFLQKYRPGSRFAVDVEEALVGYCWPGNVRELRNAVISAASLTFSSSREIEATALPREIIAVSPGRSKRDLVELAYATGTSRKSVGNNENGGRALAALERQSILQTLADTNGHHENTARILGISGRTLSRKLKQYRQTGSVREFTSAL